MHTVHQRHFYDIINRREKRNRLGQKLQCKQACVRSFQSHFRTHVDHAKQDNLPEGSAPFGEELPEPWACLVEEEFDKNKSRKNLNCKNFPNPVHPALRRGNKARQPCCPLHRVGMQTQGGQAANSYI